MDQSSAQTDTQDEVTEELAAIVERLRRDPLLDVEGDLKGMVWNHRGEFCAHPSMLAKVIQSVPSWSNPSDLRNLDHVVRTWAKPSPEEAQLAPLQSIGSAVGVLPGGGRVCQS